MGNHGSGHLEGAYQPSPTKSFQLDGRYLAGRIDGSSTLSLMLKFEISGTVIEWRGPAPFYFLPTPLEVTEEIETYKRELTYGWGVIPSDINIGSIEFYTALIPKDGSYLVPLKKAVREATKIDLGSRVKVKIRINSGL